jgi:GrpB-like predicted nucleotidyltransferase (UPF0157 family)
MLKIHISEYDPTWPATFSLIAASLATILTASGVPVLAIEHIGSTSVPNLAAKPIIDIDIVVAPTSIIAATQALSFGGYTFNPENNGIDRMSFRWKGHTHDSGASRPTEDGEVRRAVYLNMPTGISLQNHLAVREVLRGDPALVEEYSEVKRRLAEREFSGIGAYGGGKSEILRKILQRSEIGVEAMQGTTMLNPVGTEVKSSVGELHSFAIRLNGSGESTRV